MRIMIDTDEMSLNVLLILIYDMMWLYQIESLQFLLVNTMFFWEGGWHWINYFVFHNYFTI